MLLGLSVRDACADERDAIRDLTLAAYEEYSVQPFWAVYRRALLATLGAQKGSVERIVAERAGTLVGSVWL